MIFRNIDFHNVSEITENSDGGYTLHRFPTSVEQELSEAGQSIFALIIIIAVLQALPEWRRA